MFHNSRQEQTLVILEICNYYTNIKLLIKFIVISKITYVKTNENIKAIMCFKYTN